MRREPGGVTPLAQVPQDKAALRGALRAQRRAIPPAERAQRDAAAQAALIASPEFQRARTIALYRPFDGEVDTSALAAAAADRRVLFARPEPQGPLAFVEPTGWTRVGRRRLPIPLGSAFPLPSDALVVVPAVAIDARGIRLGLGGGHYDRTLVDHQGAKIGLVYAVQLVPRLPREPWDVAVDAAATDAGVRRFHSEENPL